MFTHLTLPGHLLFARLGGGPLRQAPSPTLLLLLVPNMVPRQNKSLSLSQNCPSGRVCLMNE